MGRLVFGLTLVITDVTGPPVPPDLLSLLLILGADRFNLEVGCDILHALDIGCEDPNKGFLALSLPGHFANPVLRSRSPVPADRSGRTDTRNMGQRPVCRKRIPERIRAPASPIPCPGDESEG
ncbi:hypothetical protein SSBR45G_12620 [Bradyrhizobium sp. SSBR45G]|nr:hypothetical protein SSBR45G_12620 [Bradyrhizobium sp. SSBR45G]GLH83162.1 hypothetical protein SSBR45R_06220 [Bradyrhizobium sp. SSBR45R]